MIKNKELRYFHVTKKENMESILEHGLIPQIGERSEELGESEKAIYLFPNIEEMENALYNWLGECFEDDEDLIIIQVDVPSDFPINQERDSNGDLFYEATSKSQIPITYITAVYDEYYKPIEQQIER